MVTEAVTGGGAGPGEPDANALRFGRYVVLSRIGEGAMGVVYSAYDEILDRRVAVKLVRRKLSGDVPGRARLLREAQALAQLSHPNVIQVHDVGEWQSQIFIALEFVHGRTLTEWLEERPRSWSEIVEVFVQAGRGLAAAHGAGIIHRDVKPDNFMIDSDGRVRVMDFGLALPVGLGGEGDAAPALSQSGRAVLRMTAAGSLIGTPAYMAPEQFLREPSDGRTDQFGFCTALFEALFGYRPFPGSTIEEVSRNVLLGERAPIPARTPVPVRIQRAVLRGLESDPNQRFPTMHDLLAELAPAPERGRKRVRWALALVGIAAASFAFVQAGTGGTCRDAAEHLVGVWDEARSATVERAMLATGLDFAADTAARTRQALDAHAAAWTDVHVRTCEAHRAGERSSAALDLQMHCLQRRKAELDALVDVLAEGDRSTVMNAAQAVAGLRSAASCGDPAALMDEQRRLGLPSDPAVAARVQLLQRDLAQVEALFLAGQIDRAVALVERTIQAAEAAGYAPTLAEALFWHGRIHSETGELDQAATSLWDAYLTSIRAGHDAIELRALVTDVHVQGYGLHDYAAAERAAAIAGALIARHPPEVGVEAELLNNLANSRAAEGRLGEAEALYRRGIELRRRTEPDNLLPLGITQIGLGEAMRVSGRVEEASAVLHEASVTLDRYLGARHPFTCVARANLGLAHLELGHLDEAGRLIEPALPQIIAAFGNDRLDFAEYFAATGALHLGRGAVTRALADLERARDLAERSQQPIIRAVTHFALARALWDHEPSQRERALTLARQAERDAIVTRNARRQREIAAWLATHAAGA
ncbi:Serine/threonine protein kinase [Nannocystis exedens]|uniref:Serine/threonine protein kinase n=1 Tax=Nannocystis exedens TaxID=54 RepID=A0A1I1Z6V8_9BACT|nr:serine/threonine-protein kinase [Nannocystis exedens]PCC75124.1 serine/threonine kinase family protein [Nannocystis exedens]SFE27526.1 Serine/threonine protein kinase [Nannocystis exedens]